MKTVSVAEGKRDFSRLIKEACEGKEGIVVTNRGKPVAVIFPYDEFLQSEKERAFKKIIETRGAFAASGVTAAEVFEESRRQLEGRK